MGVPYELAPDRGAPELPGRVVVRESAEEALEAAGGELFALSVECVRAFGDFHLALSVSPTLEGLFRALMVDPKFRALPWNRTHLWLACENVSGAQWRELHELLVEHAGIPDEQAHPIPVGQGAEAYAAILRETLAWREPGHDRLDGVMLALDDPILSEPVGGNEGLVVEMDAGVRLSRRMINASRFIGVVGVGEPASRRLNDDERLSAFGLSPLGGELYWFLDHAACEGES
ncbi:MAG: 6-phosphogluconolactonase [Phycisphaerales bacterium JB059]